MKRIQYFVALLASVLHFAVKAMTPARGVFALGSGPTQFPDFNAFMGAIANRGGDVEVIKWTLYDSAIYVAAGQTQLNFFQQPIGAGNSTQNGASAQAKQLGDTNMTQAGMLPNPQGFYIDNIQLLMLPGSVAAGTTDWAPQIPSAFAAANAATVQAGENDVYSALTTGALTLTIGTKPYVQDAPLLKFPPAQRFELQSSLATTSATAGEVVKASAFAGGDLYKLTPGIALMSGQNFVVNLQWPVVTALPSTKNGKIICNLNGWLYRGVQ